MEKSIGIIDLGSNSARLVIYKIDSSGIAIETDNVKHSLRLSSHISEDGLIDVAGFELTLNCMRKFRKIYDLRHVNELVGVATAAIRQAKNGNELLQEIQRATGIAITLLSGEEEAYFGYLAVINSMNVSDCITADIGGGSTELTLIVNRKCVKKVSLPFGAVNLTRQFIHHDPPTDAELRAMENHIRSSLLVQNWLVGQDLPLVAIGGGARNLANIHSQKMKYSLTDLHHYTMQAIDMVALYETLARIPLSKRRKIKGLSTDRADIIVTCGAIFRSILHVTRSRQFIISTQGLREGLFYHHVMGEQSTKQIEDVGVNGAHQLVKRYRIDEARSERVALIALALFDQLKEQRLLRCRKEERRILQIASLLHSIGLSVDGFKSSQQTFYLLTHMRMNGVTHRERVMVALIASYQNKKKMKQFCTRHSDVLLPEDIEVGEQLGFLLLLSRNLEKSLGNGPIEIALKKQVNRCTLTIMKGEVLYQSISRDIRKDFRMAFGKELEIIDSTSAFCRVEHEWT